MQHRSNHQLTNVRKLPNLVCRPVSFSSLNYFSKCPSYHLDRTNRDVTCNSLDRSFVCRIFQKSREYSRLPRFYLMQQPTQRIIDKKVWYRFHMEALNREGFCWLYRYFQLTTFLILKSDSSWNKKNIKISTHIILEDLLKRKSITSRKYHRTSPSPPSNLQ